MTPSIERGINGLPKVRLQSPSGADAEIYLHGAHVTSWRTPDGVERLYLSRRAVFQEGAAIRGGVPICFPQFAELGNLPKHGFARTMTWEFLKVRETPDQTGSTASFRLSSNDETRRIWAHDFTVWYDVDLGDDWLELTLVVDNNGDAPFSFTGALHTYLSVGDIHQTWIEGLGGATYLDKSDGNMPKTQTGSTLRVTAETDCAYLNAPDSVRLHQPNDELLIEKSGFHDIVIWNIWEGAGAIVDMEPGDYQRYLCVEAAAVNPVTVAPGTQWVGIQTFMPASVT